MTKKEFFAKALPAALAAGHIFPEFAVCEAALESAWGESKLAKKANNLFGQKKGKEDYPTIDIRTDEFVDGVWSNVGARWPVFPDWETSFRERMALLQRSERYKSALEATDGETFVRRVSSVWATDPNRADKVMAIYRKALTDPELQDLKYGMAS